MKNKNGKTEESRPRWESEMMGGKHVTDNIVCKTCLFRFVKSGEGQVESPEASHCEIYEYPDSKPGEVYFDGEGCEFYEKDEKVK